MKQFALDKVVRGLLLGCLVFAVAGCHRNQSAQNTAAENASQSSAQPAATPDTSQANGSGTAPAPNNVPPNAAPASAAAPASTAPSPNPAATTPFTTPAATPAHPAHSRRSEPAPAAGEPVPANPTAEQASNTPEAAPPQPAPVVVPAGTALRIRINQRISVKTSHAGDPFDGEIVSPVTVNGAEVIPAGSMARGHVLVAHRRGHFKGRSLLELKLTGLDVNGRHYRLNTDTVARTKKGKGKRSAAFIGGGTGLGMLIGGVASGGVGLLVGGLSGAGAGTLGAALTGNKDIDIPAETVMDFRLDQPIQLQ